MPASMSIASQSVQQQRQPEAAPQSIDNALCEVCRHAVVDHDAIALRFCRATKNASTVRGCVCQPA
jgi:hypothetical protein